MYDSVNTALNTMWHVYHSCSLRWLPTALHWLLALFMKCRMEGARKCLKLGSDDEKQFL